MNLSIKDDVHALVLAAGDCDDRARKKSWYPPMSATKATDPSVLLLTLFCVIQVHACVSVCVLNTFSRAIAYDALASISKETQLLTIKPQMAGGFAVRFAHLWTE